MSKPDFTGDDIRPCPSYPGYSASSAGVIYSHFRRKSLGRGRGSASFIDPARFFQLKQWPVDGGYLTVSCRHTAGTIAVHILVADAFHGPRPAGLQVRHRDGVSSNPAASNLEYGTPLQNIRDKIRHGTVPTGERHAAVRIKDAEVVSMREAAANGEPFKSIAQKHGISIRLIGQLIYGRTRAAAGGPISPRRTKAARQHDAKGLISWNPIAKALPALEGPSHE